jgi:hypothetical protein
MSLRTVLPLASIGAYLGLWAFTAYVGAPSLRAQLLEGVPVARRATIDVRPAPPGGAEHDYCATVALAPFIVRLSAGHYCGVLCGHGGTWLVFWLPGVVRPFYTLYEWFR